MNSYTVSQIDLNINFVFFSFHVDIFPASKTEVHVYCIPNVNCYLITLLYLLNFLIMCSLTWFGIHPSVPGLPSWDSLCLSILSQVVLLCHSLIPTTQTPGFKLLPSAFIPAHMSQVIKGLRWTSLWTMTLTSVFHGNQVGRRETRDWEMKSEEGKGKDGPSKDRLRFSGDLRCHRKLQ